MGALILLRLASDKGTELRLYRTRSRQGYSERRVRSKEGTDGVKVLVCRCVYCSVTNVECVLLNKS